MVIFKGTHHSLTSDDIAQVEAELGLRLPDDFRRHYMRYNGGAPDPGYFEKYGEIFGVEYFFPMRERSAGNSFEEIYNIIKSNPDYPLDFVPFAGDDGGNSYVFSTKNCNFGAVYLSQRDYFDDPDKCVIFIADGLDSFLAELTSPAD